MSSLALQQRIRDILLEKAHMGLGDFGGYEGAGKLRRCPKGTHRVCAKGPARKPKKRVTKKKKGGYDGQYFGMGDDGGCDEGMGYDGGRYLKPCRKGYRVLSPKERCVKRKKTKRGGYHAGAEPHQLMQWHDFVAEYRMHHPHLSYRDALIMASAPYQRMKYGV